MEQDKRGSVPGEQGDGVKALSLWQPWASLCALEVKEYETRSWATPYRGPLVIHASKTEQGMESFYQNNRIRAALTSWYSLPRGCALCVCELVDCIEMTPAFIDSIDATEFSFGDWSEGRFAWKLTNVRRFDKPISMRGMQGLFDVELIPEAL